MRRASVPRPKRGRRQSVPRRRSTQEAGLTSPRIETIAERNKENTPVKESNDTIVEVDDSDRYEDRNGMDSRFSNRTNIDGNNDKNELDKTEEDSMDKSTEKEMDNGDVIAGEEKTSAVTLDESQSKEGGDTKVDIENEETAKESFNADKEEVDENNTDAMQPDEKMMDDSKDDKGDDKGVDVTDNDVTEEMITEDKEILSENKLEEEWKKLTEDPHYPSLQTVEDIASQQPQQQTTDQITANESSDDVTLMTSQSNYTSYSIPPLHIPESVRWTNHPTPAYTSSRAVTDIPYSSFSYQRKYPSRRHSIPKPLSSSKEPDDYHRDNNKIDEGRNDFNDDNSMLLSARKLDSLLFRLFYKNQNIHNFNYPTITDTKQAAEIVKDQETSSVPTFKRSGADIISMDPVTWQLRPMKATEKETLRSELQYLEDNLDSKEIIKKLFMDGVITHLDYNQLMHTEGQGSRAVIRLLIGTLQRRGERAFPAFMQALKDLNLTRIYDKLDSTERELARGIEDDRDELERRTRMEESQSILPSFRPSTFPSDRIEPSTYDEHPPTNKHLDPIPSTPPPVQQQQPPEGSSVRVSNREDYDKEVEKQLTELNAELKALHEDINTLRSSRANAPQDATPNNSQNNPQLPPKSSSCNIL